MRASMLDVVFRIPDDKIGMIVEVLKGEGTFIVGTTAGQLEYKIKNDADTVVQPEKQSRKGHHGHARYPIPGRELALKFFTDEGHRTCKVQQLEAYFEKHGHNRVSAGPRLHDLRKAGQLVYDRNKQLWQLATPRP